MENEYQKEYIGLKLEAERIQDAIIAEAIQQAQPVDSRDDPFNFIKRSKLAHKKSAQPREETRQTNVTPPIRIMESKFIK